MGGQAIKETQPWAGCKSGLPSGYLGNKEGEMSILSIFRILKRIGKEHRELGERVRDGK